MRVKSHRGSANPPTLGASEGGRGRIRAAYSAATAVIVPLAVSACSSPMKS